ncbi:MAG: adenosylhomocysteinase, partial [Thermoleophilales bacterium]|nr:adenosylhomocysteinase [Thermoleophilales bacterium]
LRSIRERFAADRPLAGLKVGACLHVTAETANLCRTLVGGGAQVALCASNPLTTQDDVAGALRERHGVEVLGSRGEDFATWAGHVEQVVARRPQITLDDGADLVLAVHESEDAVEKLIGGTEETATGLVKLRALEAEGGLKRPVMAVNEAHTERAFNDRYGTGQSALDGIIRATNILLAGRTVVVLGYGWAGKGVAERARGLGASVIVCEVDALHALEARMEGFDVMPALAAAERGDIFITVTGVRDVLTREHFDRMKDGAILANAGHFDVEISLPDLRAVAAGEPREVLPLVHGYELADGRRLNLLTQGYVVNLAAAQGHPAGVMDVSFATQALAAEELAQRGADLPSGVVPVPPRIDAEVAGLKLESLGVAIDVLTLEQREYLHSWRPKR